MWPLLIFGFVLFFGGVAQLFGFGHPHGWDYFWAIGEIIVGAACLSAGGLGGIVDEPEHKDKGRPYQEPPERPIDWAETLRIAKRDYPNDGIDGATDVFSMFVQHNRPNEAKQYAEYIGLDATNAAIRNKKKQRRRNAPTPIIGSTEELDAWLRWKRGEEDNPRFGD